MFLLHHVIRSRTLPKRYTKQLSRARGARLKGRLHAEVRRLESSILSPFSLGCRPGIDCRERVEKFGGFFSEFSLRATEARTLTCYLVRQLTTRTTLGITTTGRRASQPRVNCFAVCCALPAGPAIGYGRKFKLYIFSLVFLKTTFLVVGSYSTPPPRGLGAKQRSCIV